MKRGEWPEVGRLGHNTYYFSDWMDEINFSQFRCPLIRKRQAHMTSLLQFWAIAAGQSRGNFRALISRRTWAVMQSLQVV